MHFWFFHRKNKVITTLKRQMKKCGGKTAISTLRGGRIDIRLAPSRDGIETSGLKGGGIEMGGICRYRDQSQRAGRNDVSRGQRRQKRRKNRQ